MQDPSIETQDPRTACVFLVKAKLWAEAPDSTHLHARPELRSNEGERSRTQNRTEANRLGEFCSAREPPCVPRIQNVRASLAIVLLVAALAGCGTSSGEQRDGVTSSGANPSSAAVHISKCVDRLLSTSTLGGAS